MKRSTKGWLFSLGFLLLWLTGCSTGCVPLIYPYAWLTRAPQQLTGVAVDQDGKPVQGARLRFEERELVFLLPLPIPFTVFRPTVPRFVTTDDQGHFQLSYHLERLELKSGHKRDHLLARDKSRWSWSESRDRQNRSDVLFYDFRKADPAQVTSGTVGWSSHYTDGRDYFVAFDRLPLSTPWDKPAPGDDMIFNIKDLGDGDFMLTVRAVQGGMMGSAKLPFAPKSGYSKGFSVLYRKSGGELETSFFLVSNDGRKHFWVTAEIPGESQDKIRFTYLLNNTGNRFIFKPTAKEEKDLWKGFSPLFQEPWWKQRQERLYPIMAESDFKAMLPPYDEKNWPNELIRMDLAKQVHAPVSILEELSRLEFRTRSIVAENPAAPRAILERLAFDADPHVARTAQKNINKKLLGTIWLSDYLESKGNFQNNPK